MFKAECWKSPTKTRGNKDIYAGDKVSPKGCTPHTDKKGSGLLGLISQQTDAKFIRWFIMSIFSIIQRRLDKLI